TLIIFQEDMLEGLFMYGYTYDVDPLFWLKLVLLLTIISLLIFIFNFIMRKWLKVDKKPSFFISYVNDKHKKIHRLILVAFLIILTIGFMINVTRHPMESVWFLEPYILVFFFFVTSEIARATMERKYAPNKKDYILTL